MIKPNPNTLSAALDRVANVLESNPAPVVGLKVTAIGGAPGSSTTGMRVSVGPDGGTGLTVVVNAGRRNPDELALVQELRDAAQAVKQGKAPESWIKSLLSRATNLGVAIVTGAAEGAMSEAVKYFGGA